MKKTTHSLRWGNQAFFLRPLHKIQKSELGLTLLKSLVAAHATADCPSPTDFPQAASAWLSPTRGSELCPGIEGTGLGRPGARLSIITHSVLLSPPSQGGGSSLRSPRRRHQPPGTAIWRGASVPRVRRPGGTRARGVCRAESQLPSLLPPSPGHFLAPTNMPPTTPAAS